jgi:hypothetical protein
MSYLPEKLGIIVKMINNVVDCIDSITTLLPEGIRDKVKRYTRRISTNINFDPTMSSLIRSCVQSFHGEGNSGDWIGNFNQRTMKLLQTFGLGTIDNYKVIK